MRIVCVAFCAINGYIIAFKDQCVNSFPHVLKYFCTRVQNVLSVRSVMQLTLLCAIVHAQFRQPNIIRCATADAPTSSPAHTAIARQLSPTSYACHPQRRHAHSNRAHVRNIMRRQHIERAEASDSTSADGHNTAQDLADHTRSTIKASCTACTPSTPAFVRKAHALLIALSRAAYRGSRMRAHAHTQTQPIRLRQPHPRTCAQYSY